MKEKRFEKVVECNEEIYIFRNFVLAFLFGLWIIYLGSIALPEEINLIVFPIIYTTFFGLALIVDYFSSRKVYWRKIK